jgi:hypothetical protein
MSIPFGGLVKLEKDGFEGVPESDNPFYVAARDGLFVAKKMLIGRGVARVEKFPDTFPSLGNGTGIFDFDESNPLPAKLMGQVVNFFERIYDRQSTEAAVLLIMNADTREWRIFVPTQLVSHGGVNYVFEPSHIRWPWNIVGSIHSHCDFGAGHSSTDTGDAENFDGLHCTIGHIKRDVPEIVAMVAMNKKFFHYKDEQFPMLFDFSEAKQHPAPDWWDRYVEDTKTHTKPVGFELYKKYDRPTVVKVEKAPTTIKKLGPGHSPGYRPTGYNPQDWVWSETEHRMVFVPHRQPQVGKGERGLTVVSGRGSEDYPSRRPYELSDSEDAELEELWNAMWGQEPTTREKFFDGFSVAQLEAMGYGWDEDIRDWRWVGGKNAHEAIRNMAERGVHWTGDGALSEQKETYWEDGLPREFVEALLNSLCITDDDIDFAVGNPSIGGELEFWKDMFIKKALGAIRVLQAAGINAHLVMTPTPNTALLPDDTKNKMKQVGPN